jgi:hypothetical protein
MRKFFDIIVEEFAKIQAQFYRQMGMDFSQYFYKYVEQEALEYVSNDRELVIRDIDVVTEYGDKILEIEDILNQFVLCNQKNGKLERFIFDSALNLDRHVTSHTNVSHEIFVIVRIH